MHSNGSLLDWWSLSLTFLWRSSTCSSSFFCAWEGFPSQFPFFLSLTLAPRRAIPAPQFLHLNSCTSPWVFGRFRGGCDSLWDRSGVTSTTIGEDSLNGWSPPNTRWKFNLCEFNLFFKKIIYTYNQVAEMNSFRQPPAEFSTNSPSPTLSPPCGWLLFFSGSNLQLISKELFYS